ncbi:MAG: hypothetical protein K6E10_01535 [Eubacterium sp.]|nr:hypothetical protein [Eubacterium sp.]
MDALKKSKGPYKKRLNKKKSSSKRLSKKKSAKKALSLNETMKESSSKEGLLKDKTLGEKIIIVISIFVLTIFPFIVIITSLAVIIYNGVSEKKAETEHRIEKRESNEDLYGEYLYLDKINENTYRVVSEGENPKKRLEWDDEFCGYYDDMSDGYVWYDVKRKKWKYWFNGISTDYKDYGWMVYEPEGWKIQKDQVDWIELSEKYDRSKLWYIEQEE